MSNRSKLCGKRAWALVFQPTSIDRFVKLVGLLKDQQLAQRQGPPSLALIVFTGTLSIGAKPKLPNEKNTFLSSSRVGWRTCRHCFDDSDVEFFVTFGIPIPTSPDGRRIQQVCSFRRKDADKCIGGLTHVAYDCISSFPAPVHNPGPPLMMRKSSLFILHCSSSCCLSLNTILFDLGVGVTSYPRVTHNHSCNASTQRRWSILDKTTNVPARYRT